MFVKICCTVDKLTSEKNKAQNLITPNSTKTELAFKSSVFKNKIDAATKWVHSNKCNLKNLIFS